MYIELNLDSRSKLHSSFVESLNDDNFKRPFLQNWKAFIIVVKQWGNENTNCIIAVLQATFKKVKYTYILNSIQKSLSVPWTMRFNNETFELSAKLHKHVIYFESDVLPLNNITTLAPGIGDTVLTVGQLKENAHHFMLKRDWKDLKTEMRDHHGGVMITKMYFCNLVELETFEYTEYLGEITVKTSNKSLGTGEYLKVLGKDGDIRLRICLEDLYPPLNTASKRHVPCLGIFVLCVTIFLSTFVKSTL